MFLFATVCERFKTDDVVPNFVKEQRQADRRTWVGRFDPANDPPVGIANLPGAAAHVPAPAPHADVVLDFNPPENRLEVVHGSGGIGGAAPTP